MQDIISKENIGRRLKELRNSYNLSQTEFAQRVNITRGNYAQVERGKQFPPYDMLINISREFNKSYEWILHGFDVSEVTRELLNEPAGDIHIEGENIPVKLRKPHFVKGADGLDKAFIVKQDQHLNYIANSHNDSFLNLLPVFNFPLSISNHMGQRAFEVHHDDMGDALVQGDIAICKPVYDFAELNESNIYILVTKDAIRIHRFSFFTENCFVGFTDSKRFEPITVQCSTIIEVWEVFSRLTLNLGVSPVNDDLGDMAASLLEMKLELKNLKAKGTGSRQAGSAIP